MSTHSHVRDDGIVRSIRCRPQWQSEDNGMGSFDQFIAWQNVRCRRRWMLVGGWMDGWIKPLSVREMSVAMGSSAVANGWIKPLSVHEMVKGRPRQSRRDMVVEANEGRVKAAIVGCFDNDDGRLVLLCRSRTLSLVSQSTMMRWPQLAMMRWQQR